jgi:hypothetical protein
MEFNRTASFSILHPWLRPEMQNCYTLARIYFEPCKDYNASMQYVECGECGDVCFFVGTHIVHQFAEDLLIIYFLNRDFSDLVGLPYCL